MAENNKSIITVSIDIDEKNLDEKMSKAVSGLSKALTKSLTSTTEIFAKNLGENIQIAFDDTVLKSFKKPIKLKLDTEDAKVQVNNLVEPLKDLKSVLDKIPSNSSTGKKRTSKKTTSTTEDSVTSVVEEDNDGLKASRSRDIEVRRLNKLTKTIKDLGGTAQEYQPQIDKLKKSLVDIGAGPFNDAQIKKLDSISPKIVKLKNEIEGLVNIRNNKSSRQNFQDDLERSLMSVQSELRGLGVNEKLIDQSTRKISGGISALNENVNLLNDILQKDDVDWKESIKIINRIEKIRNLAESRLKTLNEDRDSTLGSVIDTQDNQTRVRFQEQEAKSQRIRLEKQREIVQQQQQENQLLNQARTIDTFRNQYIEDYKNDIQQIVNTLKQSETSEENIAKITKSLTSDSDKIVKNFALLNEELKQPVLDFQKIEKIIKNINSNSASFNANATRVGTDLGGTVSDRLTAQLTAESRVSDIKSIVNKDAIDKARQALERQREEAVKLGVDLLYVTKNTRNYDSEIIKVEKDLEYLNQEFLANRISAEKAIPKYEALLQEFKKLKIGIDQIDPNRLKEAFNLQETDPSKLAFRLGILGFTLQSIGSQLTNFSRNVFQTFDRLSQFAEPIQRVRNNLELQVRQGTILASQQEGVLRRLRAIGDIPGSSVEDANATYNALEKVNVTLEKRLDLVEGIAKVAASPGGTQDSAKQLSDVLAAISLENVVDEDRFKTLRRSGGNAVVNMMSALGFAGGKDIERFGIANFIDEVAKALKNLQSPADTTTDKMNRLKSRMAELGTVLGDILGPGLDKLNTILTTKIIPILNKLQESFNGLPDSTKAFISNLLIAIPVLSGAAGSLLILAAGFGAVFSGIKQLQPLMGTFSKWRAGRGLTEILGITKAFENLGIFAKNTISIFKASGGGIAGFFTIFKTGITGVLGGFAKLLGLTNPIGLAINGIISVISALWSNFGGIADRFYVAFSKLNTAISEMLKELGIEGGILTILEGIISAIDYILNIVGTVLLESIIAVANTLRDVFKNITGIIKAIKNGDIVGALGQGLNLVFNSLFGILKNLIIGLVAFLGDGIAGLIEKIPGGGKIGKGIREQTDYLRGFIGTDKASVNELNRQKEVNKLVEEERKNQEKANVLMKEREQRLMALNKLLQENAEKARSAYLANQYEKANFYISQQIDNLKTQKQLESDNFKRELDAVTDQIQLDELKARRISKLQEINNSINQLQLQQGENSFLATIRQDAGNLYATDEAIKSIIASAYNNDLTTDSNLVQIVNHLNYLASSGTVQQAFEQMQTLERLVQGTQLQIPIMNLISKARLEFEKGNYDVVKAANDAKVEVERQLEEIRKKNVELLQWQVEYDRNAKKSTEELSLLYLKNSRDIQYAELERNGATQATLDNHREISESLTREKEIQTQLNDFIAEATKLQLERYDLNKKTQKEIDLDQKRQIYQEKLLVEQKNRNAILTQKQLADNQKLNREISERIKLLRQVDSSDLTKIGNAFVRSFQDGIGVLNNLRSSLAISDNDLIGVNYLVNRLEQIRKSTLSATKQFEQMKLEINSFVTGDEQSQISTINRQISDAMKTSGANFVDVNTTNDLIFTGLTGNLDALKDTLKDIYGRSDGDSPISRAIQDVFESLRNNDFKNATNIIQNQILPIIGNDVTTSEKIINSLFNNYDVTTRGNLKTILDLFLQRDKVMAVMTRKTEDSTLSLDLGRLNTEQEQALRDIDERMALIQQQSGDRTESRTIDTQNAILGHIARFEAEKEDIRIQFETARKIRENKDNKEEIERIIAQGKREREENRRQLSLRLQEMGALAQTGTGNVGIGNVTGDARVNQTQTKPNQETQGQYDVSRIQAIINRSMSAIETGTFDKITQDLRDFNKAVRDLTESNMQLFESFASGQFIIDKFGAFLTKARHGFSTFGESLRELGTLFTDFAQMGVAALGQALGEALTESILNGGNFLKNLGKFFGDILISLGTTLIQLGAAALALAALGTFFPILMPSTGGPQGVPAALATIAVGAGLLFAGKALGGGGARESNQNTSNNANNSSGNSGQVDYDPEKDPKLQYQRALRLEMMLDIRTDDSQIIKAVVKGANRDPRFGKLIGNGTSNFVL